MSTTFWSAVGSAARFGMTVAVVATTVASFSSRVMGDDEVRAHALFFTPGFSLSISDPTYSCPLLTLPFSVSLRTLSPSPSGPRRGVMPGGGSRERTQDHVSNQSTLQISNNRGRRQRMFHAGMIVEADVSTLFPPSVVSLFSASAAGLTDFGADISISSTRRWRYEAAAGAAGLQDNLRLYTMTRVCFGVWRWGQIFCRWLRLFIEMMAAWDCLGYAIDLGF